ncbi:hypothetical protein G5714_012195 [Onychostoma macrolepis]|uniref:TNFR-Cys domain-containing protein n=1 Tax=Onychostoma macrolepis TaxID=369639 RepID=A0A7J6CKV0_9TELE|nr:hypothetical protein G5714_012195 [Onychostoma macrolepis]
MRPTRDWRTRRTGESRREVYRLKVRKDCTHSADTTCEPQEGFHCIKLNKDSCALAVEHSACNPGQYIKQTGRAFSDTVCADCTDGTYSDGSLMACLPHSKCETMGLTEVKAGTTSSDAECEKVSTYNKQLTIHNQSGTVWTDSINSCTARNEIQTEIGSSVKDVRCTSLFYIILKPVANVPKIGPDPQIQNLAKSGNHYCARPDLAQFWQAAAK